MNLPLYHLLYLPPPGVIEYCWIHNVSVEAVAPTSDGITDCRFRYNLTGSVGWGGAEAHEETFSGQAGLSKYTYEFNTVFNEAANATGWPMELDTAIVFFQAPAGVTSTGILVQNNTLVAKGRTGHLGANGLTNNTAFNQGIMMDCKPTGRNISPVIKDNYIDTSNIRSTGAAISLDRSTVSAAAVYRNISVNSGAMLRLNKVGVQ